MLVIYVAGVSVGYLLMVTNGIFQDDPASQLDLLMSFTTFRSFSAGVGEAPGVEFDFQHE